MFSELTDTQVESGPGWEEAVTAKGAHVVQSLAVAKLKFGSLSGISGLHSQVD